MAATPPSGRSAPPAPRATSASPSLRSLLTPRWVRMRRCCLHMVALNSLFFRWKFLLVRRVCLWIGVCFPADVLLCCWGVEEINAEVSRFCVHRLCFTFSPAVSKKWKIWILTHLSFDGAVLAMFLCLHDVCSQNRTPYTTGTCLLLCPSCHHLHTMLLKEMQNVTRTPPMQKKVQITGLAISEIFCGN